MTFREKYEHQWLSRLRTLPEPVFRECVLRAQRGERAVAIARWLLSVADRGDLRNVTNVHTMRRYTEVLRTHVLRAKKNLPPTPVTTKELELMVEQERRRIDNEVAIHGGPLQREQPPAGNPDAAAQNNGHSSRRHTPSMIEYLVQRNAETSEQIVWLNSVAQLNWERLHLALLVEEKKEVPIAETTKISQQIIKAAEATTRAILANNQINKMKAEASKPDCLNCDFGTFREETDDESADARGNGSTTRPQSKAARETDSASAAHVDAEPPAPKRHSVSPNLLKLIQGINALSDHDRKAYPIILETAVELTYSFDMGSEEKPQLTADCTETLAWLQNSITAIMTGSSVTTNSTVREEPSGHSTQVANSAAETLRKSAAGQPSDLAETATSATLSESVPASVDPSTSKHSSTDLLREVAQEFGAAGKWFALKIYELEENYRKLPAAERAAVCSALEAKLIMAESKEMFRPGASENVIMMSSDDYVVVQEYARACSQLSREAILVAKGLEELATEIWNESCRVQNSRI